MRLRWLDRIGAWGLLLLGCVHNFLAAPAIYSHVEDGLFWFLGAGLSLWYAAAINFVRQAGSARTPIIAAIPVNATMLAFVIAYGVHSGEIASAGGMLLVALAAIETIFSVLQAAGRYVPADPTLSSTQSP